MEWFRVYDLHYGGCFFTWSNKKGGHHRVMSKIDRVLGNELWEEVFLNASIVFHPEGLFDHSPMVVSFTQPPQGRNPFRFFNYWASKADFAEKVRLVWNSLITGHLGYQISQKLWLLQKHLHLCYGQGQQERVLSHDMYFLH